MGRVWKETIASNYLHEQMGIYKGAWMPQMDRCWMSDDVFQVTSRLLMTEWGKVEHAAITMVNKLTMHGEGDLPWALKMEIKNEVFGENRLAIKVYGKKKPRRERL